MSTVKIGKGATEGNRVQLMYHDSMDCHTAGTSPLTRSPSRKKGVMVHKQQLERASNSGKRDVALPPTASRHWQKVCWRLDGDWAAVVTIKPSQTGMGGPEPRRTGTGSGGSCAVLSVVVQIAICDGELDRKRDGTQPNRCGTC
jgi:hypothetical protein